MKKMMLSMIKSTGLVLGVVVLGVPALAFADAQSDVVSGAQSLSSGGPTLGSVVTDIINVLSASSGLLRLL